jgi:uncharacterized protein (TIGR03437 family)
LKQIECRDAAPREQSHLARDVLPTGPGMPKRLLLLRAGVPGSHGHCVYLILFATLSLQAATTPSLIVQVSNETTSSPGSTQIEISLVSPALIASGRIVMDFDPSIFASLSNPGVFGSKSDAYGAATISGLHLDASFYSPSGGVGQTRQPFFVVSAAILPGISPGTIAAITLDASQSAWKDPNGNQYSVSATPGSVTVGGSLSISPLSTGGELLPAGDVVVIAGTGLSAATAVSIDGVVSSAAYNASSQRILVTLGAPAELTGKRLVANNPDGSQAEYYLLFNALYPIALPASRFTGVQPMFPIQSWPAVTAEIEEEGGVVAFQNPNPLPVQVRMVTYQNCCGPLAVADDQTVTIPAGFWGAYQGNDDSMMVITASAPIQALQFGLCGSLVGNYSCASPVLPTIPSGPTLTFQPASVSWNWQIGSPPPSPRTILVGPPGDSIFTAVPSTGSGGAWLSVAPTQNDNGTFTLSADPSGLGAGVYPGTIEVTTAMAQPVAIPVSLTVSTSAAPPQMTATPTSLSFSLTYGTATPLPQTIALSSSGGLVAFSAYASSANATPLPWLHVTPSIGTTPTTLTILFDPTVLEAPIIGTYTGSVIVSGPGNAIAIPVQFTISGLAAYPASLVFSAQTGTGVQTQAVSLTPNPTSAPTFSVTVSSGSGWLSAAAGSAPEANISVNPAGLASGNYEGTVIINSAGAGTAQIHVALSVWTTPPPLTVTPSSLTFTAQLGGILGIEQTLSVQSAGVALPLTISATAASGTTPNWLDAVDPNAAPTPANINVIVGEPSTLPGEYTGTISIGAPSGTVNVPVTVLITVGGNVLPVIGAIVNAASQAPGAIAPGEILTIYGFGIGPSQTAGFTLNPSGGAATSLNGAEVLFDGRAAPMIYGSAGQVNVIVPYEVAGQPSTTIEIVSSGTKSEAWGVPVVPSSPGILTDAGNGVGQAAVLNQDNSLNGPSNPAAIGMVIQIYATGEGQTSPPGVTGSITQSNTKTPVLPVTVTIGGINATVNYAGSAPDSVAGLLQINAVVPPGVTPGSAVPIALKVGSAVSQDGVTIAVK